MVGRMYFKENLAHGCLNLAISCLFNAVLDGFVFLLHVQNYVVSLKYCLKMYSEDCFKIAVNFKVVLPSTKIFKLADL